MPRFEVTVELDASDYDAAVSQIKYDLAQGDGGVKIIAARKV